MISAMRGFGTKLGWILVAAAVGASACADDGGNGSGGATTGGATSTDGSADGSAGPTATDSSMATSGATTAGADDSDSGGETDGPPMACEPFGKWPAPETTFVLPAREGTGIYYPDVQASFPEVDWATLDRLYVPAGQYTQLNLGNLPDRSPDDPLVITNMGGQVRIGPPNPTDNFLWAMEGGSNWVLTGRYDADAGTGDESAPGHRCGEYASSRGNYGFWSDDAFAMRDYLHMGISVGHARAYEIEFVEVERSGFAGIRLLNSWDDGELPMADVRVHDNYVHDVDGEGIYFGWTGGPPSNLTPGLQVYNNRFVRTGNEALQIQDIGPGTEIHHNVIAWAALHWRDNGLGAYQDGNSQISIREGDVEIHHNVFIGGAGTLGSFWSQAQSGDGDRNVVFHDNYFADSRNQAVYFGGSMTSGSSLAFTDNFVRGLEFSYDDLDPMATPPTAVFRLAPEIGGDVSFTGNAWDSDLPLVEGGMGPAQSDNVQGPLDAIAFVDSGYPPGVPVDALEAWTAVSTLAPGSPARDYVVGELVTYDGQLYTCVAANTDQPPPEHPESWMQLPAPPDDLRVMPGTAYEGFGVQ
mgnify:CR=1 FL=1